MFAGCSKKEQPDIVVTMYAQYDWVKQVLGSNPAGLSVGFLMSNGVDPHNYSPSARDIASIKSCKLFIYNGASDSKWANDAMKNSRYKDRRVIGLMNHVVTKQIEWDDHDHEHDDDCFHGDIGDEHVWLSLRFARVFVQEIAEVLGRIDPVNEEYYMENAGIYRDELAALDTKYIQAVAEGNTDTVLFADRFPFFYMMEDYNLNWHAAFSGCSASVEISVSTLISLKQKVGQYGLDVILILENSANRKIAQTIINDTTATKIREMDSIQSVNAKQAKNTSYIKIMEANLEVLKEALK